MNGLSTGLLDRYDRQAMIAKLAEMEYGKGWNRTNIYVCETFDWDHSTRTIERTPGVTPFMIPCDQCDGAHYMRSTMGRLPEVPDERCQYEWDLPSNAEFAELEPEMQRHVIQGGLIRRPNPNFKPAVRRDRFA